MHKYFDHFSLLSSRLLSLPYIGFDTHTVPCSILFTFQSIDILNYG